MTDFEKAVFNKGRITGILDAMSTITANEGGASVEMFEEFREELEKAVEDLFFLIEKECGMKNAECENGDDVPYKKPLRGPGDMVSRTELKALIQRLKDEKKNFKPAKPRRG